VEAWAYPNLGLLLAKTVTNTRDFCEVFLEWAPCDPTENDTVVSMWRKSRLCIYAKAAQARKLYHLFFRRTREPSLDS
jgi:hypothetical protein